MSFSPGDGDPPDAIANEHTGSRGLLFRARMDLMSTTIGLFLFDGAEELDWAGPWEVLAAWAENHPEDEVEVFTFSQAQKTVRCAKGLQVIPDHTWATMPELDVLVYPGGRGVRSHLGNNEITEWLRGVAKRAEIVSSVCTGSLVLADAGLLDGLAATTHWENVDMLFDLGDDVEVRPEERFVDTGSIITAAGVSAGIDMALHLIVRLQSEERARQVRRYIQYDPEPPV